MARRSEPEALGGRGMKKPYLKVMFKIAPDQLEALRAEAMRRAKERQRGRIDASEVLREAVDAWMKRRGK
jgi:hypothetical protein